MEVLEVNKYAQNFFENNIKTINKSWKFQCCKEVDKELLRSIIEKAYPVITQRTIEGNRKLGKAHDEAKAELVNSFFDFFNNKVTLYEEEAGVLSVANCYYNKLYAAAKEHGITFCFGRAQKIVNVVVKYLYCVLEKDIFNKYFKGHNHMILDSYTLDWYYDEVCNENDKEKVVWTQLDINKYLKIQKNILDKLKENKKYKLLKQKEVVLPQNPFIAEFVIWPERKARTILKDIEAISKLDDQLKNIILEKINNIK